MLKYKGDIFSKIGLQWLLANSDTRLSIVDKQVLNSYLKEISTINELISDVEKEMANLAINDRRVELLLGFTGIDYYGVLYCTTMKIDNMIQDFDRNKLSILILHITEDSLF